MKSKDIYVGNLIMPRDETIPIKQDIIILPADDPKQLKLGWKCWETMDGKMPDGTDMDDLFQPEKCKAFDLADQYKIYHHKMYVKPDGVGYTVIPVLEFLNGKPWDNMALNFVAALRPSSIRVTTGGVTCDASTWRVTVFVETDERTIRKIEQEVQVGLHGIRNGHDASLYMRGVEIPKHQPTSIINTRGLKKLVGE